MIVGAIRSAWREDRPWYSDFGASFVYVIFDDQVDLCLRARYSNAGVPAAVLPQLLPEASRRKLGPEHNSLGRIFQYVLVDDSGRKLADLRSYQDWYVKYRLKAVAGVSEVAVLGRRRSSVSNQHRSQSTACLSRHPSADCGGGTAPPATPTSAAAHQPRWRRVHDWRLGRARSTDDLEQVLITTMHDGTPVRVRDLGVVEIGEVPRRGVTDLDGDGDVVSGIIVMRHGENALAVMNA